MSTWPTKEILILAIYEFLWAFPITHIVVLMIFGYEKLSISLISTSTIVIVSVLVGAFWRSLDWSKGYLGPFFVSTMYTSGLWLLVMHMLLTYEITMDPSATTFSEAFTLVSVVIMPLLILMWVVPRALIALFVADLKEMQPIDMGWSKSYQMPPLFEYHNKLRAS